MFDYIQIYQNRISFILTVKPKNLTIYGAVDGKLFGQEGKSLQLLCTVISGIPKETLTWYNMSSVIGTGGPGKLEKIITPTRYDDNKSYTCQVNSDSLQALLQETITLEIQCEFLSYSEINLERKVSFFIFETFFGHLHKVPMSFPNV